MALKRNETYPGRFSNPTAEQPQGAFKNRSAPSAQDGSFCEQQWANDWSGFFSRLLTVAGITPNGNIDSALSSQYYDALLAATPGRFLGVKVFTSSGTYSPNPLAKKIRVTLTGGGGGGGGAFNGGGPSDNFSGAGGASGSTGIKIYNISDISNFSVVVGSGGTEAVRGGDSSFSGMTAVGGAPSIAVGVYASGGIGLAGTGGDINIAGGDGGDGQNNTRLLNGNGGISFWGGSRRSGQGAAGTPSITKAAVYGGGGGGIYDTQKFGIRFFGGSGADGICVIEEYS